MSALFPADSLEHRGGAAPTGGIATLPPVRKQATFFSPATGTQKTGGDSFSWAVRSVIKDGSTTKPDRTSGEFLVATAAKVATQATGDFHGFGADDLVMKPQKAIFRALPDDGILKDYLFKAGAPAAGP